LKSKTKYLKSFFEIRIHKYYAEMTNEFFVRGKGKYVRYKCIRISKKLFRCFVLLFRPSGPSFVTDLLTNILLLLLYYFGMTDRALMSLSQFCHTCLFHITVNINIEWKVIFKHPVKYLSFSKFADEKCEEFFLVFFISSIKKKV
jgi:hypothetical protein